jgi:hypothetical protein
VDLGSLSAEQFDSRRKQVSGRNSIKLILDEQPRVDESESDFLPGRFCV